MKSKKSLVDGLTGVSSWFEIGRTWYMEVAGEYGECVRMK
jgi:hypothetical protein